MQTRHRARAAEPGQHTRLPSIHAPLQLQILDLLLSQYPEPDSVEYIMFPFKSTLAWLLSLRLVNLQWKEHVQQHPAMIRRCRLESLRNLSLLHDYAHYIVTARASKKKRLKAVPEKLTLRFSTGSICFAVPKSLNKAEKTGGLPNNTLVLVASYDQFSTISFLDLLGDLDCLDQRHAAPMVLKVLTTSRAGVSTSRSSNGLSSGSRSAVFTSDAQKLLLPTLPASTATATAAAGSPPPDMTSAVATVQQLVAAAKLVLQERLPYVAMEGTESSPALYFIPTKHGFCRRVKRES